VRKIAATYIFPVNRPPVKNGILICKNDGTVVDIIENNEKIREQSNLEYYSGILVPGFVNAHCHLELSYLKNKLPEKSGIGDFLGCVNRLRNIKIENAVPEIQKADRKLWASGTVAVGDISNTTLSLETKRKSRIYYHTFVETFGFHPSRAERSFDIAQIVRDEFVEAGLSASIVPHSRYSVSVPLFERIGKNAEAEKSILAIHNQESSAEAQFYKDGSGPIANHLQHNLGIDISHWKPTGKSSLNSTLKFLPNENQLLLVHNTFTGQLDIEKIKIRRSMKNTFFVLCPNSNMYIENKLPPVELFRSKKLNICIGTDSLASNHYLSVLKEIITLQKYFSETEPGELIEWACLNGARALKIDDKFGSFESGKKPGVNLITGIDFRNMKLTEKSKVTRLL
jgi:cytosine/adenosine deaminase-related metal-dependent hydrolase